MTFSDYELIKDLTRIPQNTNLGQMLTQKANVQEGDMLELPATEGFFPAH